MATLGDENKVTLTVVS